MPLWGKSDAASNTCLVWLSQVGATQNSANRTAVFGNTTVSGVVSGVTVGIFGADTTEANLPTGNVISYIVTSQGSGYTANAVVTLAGGGGSSAAANATANATGYVSAVNANVVGSGYSSRPSVTIAAPSAITFNANTGVAANGLITLTNKFQVDDFVTYTVAAGNTAVVGLVTGTQYYIKTANSSTSQLASSKGGTIITLTPSTTSETGHTLRGETATAAAVINGGENVGVTPGWNLRTVGTGGRAGRVQNECLVAMRNITSDASDDTVLPDA